MARFKPEEVHLDLFTIRFTMALVHTASLIDTRGSFVGDGSVKFESA